MGGADRDPGPPNRPENPARPSGAGRANAGCSAQAVTDGDLDEHSRVVADDAVHAQVDDRCMTVASFTVYGTMRSYLRCSTGTRGPWKYAGIHPAAVAPTVVRAYGGLVDTARGVACARCGGVVVVASETSHPCGVYVQHGRCADCGVQLWRLLDERRIPVANSRGYWMTAVGGAEHTVRRLSRRADRAESPSNRPAQRADPTRPGS